MTRDQIREALTSSPFVPFLLRFPDGRSLLVAHPEFIALSPNGRAAWVYDRTGAGRMVDLLLVSDIEFVPGRRARRSA